MSNIDLLKQKNITFHYITERDAELIMSTEYSYYKLIEYSALFDRYIKGDRKGCFINLDFYQLYILARIDQQLSSVIMHQCMEIEQRLKTILLSDIDSSNIFSLDEYIKSDSEYIYKTYSTDNFPIIENKYQSDSVDNLKTNEFLDVAQFGTLERIIAFYNQKCYNNNMASSLYYAEILIESVKRLRNMAAHNCSIISQLNQTHEYNYNYIASFLGNNGINKKNLKTNISKTVMFDFSNLMHMYYCLGLKNGFREMQSLLNMMVDNYANLFFKNSTLISAVKFAISVVNLYQNKKILDN